MKIAFVTGNAGKAATAREHLAPYGVEVTHVQAGRLMGTGCGQPSETGLLLISDAEMAALQPGLVPDPERAARFMTGVSRKWHAVERAVAVRTLIRAEAGGGDSAPASVAVAVCGELARVAAKYGTYDRVSTPVASAPCPACAWHVALATGSADREIRLLTPGRTAAARLAASGVDPLLGVNTVRAVIAQETGDDCEYGLDHPATIALLAHVTAHAPALTISALCADGDCCRAEQAAEDHGGDLPDGWACDDPWGDPVCLGCSLTTGSRAGGYEGMLMDACHVTTPCSVLLTLSAYYGVTETTSPHATKPATTTRGQHNAANHLPI